MDKQQNRRNRMKRIISMCLSAVLLLSLCVTGAAKTKTAQAEEKQKVTIQVAILAPAAIKAPLMFLPAVLIPLLELIISLSISSISFLIIFDSLIKSLYSLIFIIFFLDSYRFQFGILSSPLYSHFMFAFYPTVEKSRLRSEVLRVGTRNIN